MSDVTKLDGGDLARELVQRAEVVRAYLQALLYRVEQMPYTTVRDDFGVELMNDASTANEKLRECIVEVESLMKEEG